MILDPIVAMQMGIQGQVLILVFVLSFYSFVRLSYYFITYVHNVILCRQELNFGMKKWVMSLQKDD